MMKLKISALNFKLAGTISPAVTSAFASYVDECDTLVAFLQKGTQDITGSNCKFSTITQAYNG